MSDYNPPPNGSYRVAGQKGGRNYNVQGGQKKTLHVTEKNDSPNTIIRIPQVIDLTPSFFLIQRQSMNNPFTYSVENHDVNASYREIPLSYTIKTVLPTPSGGPYQVKLTNYVCSLPEPSVTLVGDTTNFVPGVLNGLLQIPGFITINFPGADLPATRVVSSVPVKDITERVDYKTAVSSADTTRQPISQFITQTERSSQKEGEPGAVGYNVPLTHMNAREGLRDLITVNARTGGLSKFGSLKSTPTGSLPDSSIFVDVAVTNESGSDTGIAVNYQIHLPMYSIANFSYDFTANKLMYDSVRQGKVYLYWELTPLNKMTSV